MVIIANSTSHDPIPVVLPVTVPSLETLDILPRDVLRLILSYLETKEMGKIRQLSQGFYKLTTGYEQPGMLGVENKPGYSIHTGYWGINNRMVDFQKEKGLTPKNIPSFPFFQLVGEIRNLPLVFWSHLQGTRVHTVNLWNNQIGASGVAKL